MNRKILNAFIVLVLMIIHSFRGYSQVDFGFDHLFMMRQFNLRLSAFNEYTRIKFADKGFYASKITLDYIGSFGSLGLHTNINRGPNFEVLPTNLTIIVPDSSNIMDKSKLKANSNYYEINNPFMAYGTLSIKQFELSFAVNVLTRSELNEINKPINTYRNNYYIDFESVEARKINLLLSGSIGYSWEGASIFLGLLNIPVLSRGDLNHPNFKVQPLAGIKCSIFNGYSTVMTNTKEIRVSHTQPINFSWLPGQEPINIIASIKRNFDQYSYESFNIDAQIPILSNFLLSIGFKQVWGYGNQLNSKEFERWRNSLDKILGDDLIGGLEHSTINIGLSIPLGASMDEIPLRLINSKIIQKNIYTAKRELYAYNPIGTLDIHNTSKHAVKCQVSLDLPDQFGSYRSESLNIEPDEIKTVPVYLYISDNDLKKPSQIIQMNILLEAAGKKQILSTIPVTIFDKHSWDGNTWGLKYFITVDEPNVLANAKKKYVQSYVPDSTLNEYQRQYKVLKNYITELGRNMHYVQDPTSTMYVDRVQYPVETIYEQSGDCDDLTVYLAAHLMAVGIHTVLVDIRPSPKGIDLPTAGQRQIGHIFLLVDTGLEVEHFGEIGLKEFQFVSRKSTSGKITAWIPIETTLIDQGFEKAFKEGVSQYYKEVIENNGVGNGTVHVYDQ